MHRQYILFLVSSCIKKSYNVYFPSPLYKQSSQPTLPSAPYHKVRSTQYCNSTKWLELDLNASEVREVPSAWCPVWGAQCGMPSVRCPVCGAQCPVKGHYWTPGARRKKGGWLGRPGQARPQGSRTSQGSGPDSFHSSFSFRIFLVSFFISIPLQILNSFLKILRSTFPGGGLSFHSSIRPACLCSGNASRPRHRTNTGNASSLRRPTKKQWRTKGRMVAGDTDQKAKRPTTRVNKPMVS